MPKIVNIDREQITIDENYYVLYEILKEIKSLLVQLSSKL